MLNVSLIGAGNLATHLFKVFDKADEIIVSRWYSRNLNKIKSYANRTEIIDKLDDLKAADICIIAISDDAIAGVSQQLPFTDRLVVHTSGSVGIHELDGKNRRGVLYPLQTFSEEAEVDFGQVPFCLETLDKDDLTILRQLAGSIGSPYYRISTEQRQTLHLAAVFVNNFVNQLYRVGHEITDIKNIPFDILKPLILETAKKVQHMSPFMAQTGPARRNDIKTIKRHLNLLENPMHKELYEKLTESIQQTHGRKKL